MSVIIGHIAVDSRGVATGGSGAGFKTDTIFVRPYYDKQWRKVYRPKGDAKSEIVARTMENICANDYIQYSQVNAREIYDKSIDLQWDVSQISEPCGADSMMAILVIVRALGEVLGKPETMSFKNIETFLHRANFQELKFTNKENLRRGDILVSETHVVVVLSDGDNIDRRTPTEMYLDNVAVNKSRLNEGISGAITKTSISVYSGPGTHFIEYKVIPKNTEVAILEVLTDGWFKIVYPYVQAGYGYIRDDSGTALKLNDESILPKEEEEEIIEEADYQVYFINGVVNVRSGPGKKYKNVGSATRLTKFHITQECNGWGYSKNLNGWINLARVLKL